jgi:regulator of sigma E protease
MEMLGPAQALFTWIVQEMLPFVLMITPIVFFHELGHFLAARACGVSVDTFSIGFGPAIVSWHDRKGTQWKISWIPLGGYVKFLGDINPVSFTEADQVQSLSANDKASAFAFKPLYQRALIVVAGPVANFVLAIVILAGFLMAFGSVVVAPVVSKVVPGSPAQAAGIHVGDTIVSVNGQRIESFEQIPGVIWDQAGKEVTLIVARQGNTITLHAVPRLSSHREFGQRIAQIGLEGPTSSQWKVVHYGPVAAVAEASRQTWSVIDQTFAFIVKRFTFQLSNDQIRGPLGIAQISAQVAAISWFSLFRLAAIVSISVGLINLFPIPVLDGGHLLYYGCEAVLGRPLGARAQDVGFRLGLAFILGLFLFATWNDIARLLKP